MSKIIVNGEEVVPAKKVKLYKQIKRTEVTKILKEKHLKLKEKNE
jgi:hypothetical protein